MATTQNVPTENDEQNMANRSAGSPTIGRRRSPSAVIKATAVRLVPLLLFLTIWELGARTLGAIDIAGATETLSSLVELVGDPNLWSALAESNQALFLGFLSAVLVGLPIGLFMGRNRIADAVAQGYLSILLIAPVALVIPLIIMALGFGTVSRALIVFVFVFPMIVVNSRSGVRTVPKDLLDMSRSFGATESELWRYVILPAAAPSIFTGLRIGIGRAVTGMVIAEWLLAAVGVGALLLEFRGTFQSASLFAVILVILLESLILVQFLRFIERKTIGWSMS